MEEFRLTDIDVKLQHLVKLVDAKYKTIYVLNKNDGSSMNESYDMLIITSSGNLKNNYY